MNEPAPDSGDTDRDLLLCREDRSLLPVSPSSVADIVDWTAQLKLLTPCHHQPHLLVLESPAKDCFCTPKHQNPVPDRDRRHKSHNHKQDEFQVEDTKLEQYLYGIYPYLFDDYDWKYNLQFRPQYHPIDYAFVQQQVSPRKRSIYIQWLINSVEQFQFDFETFLLAVNLFDRFMAITALKHDYDQKMAIAAAFLVAAKKEEVHYPGVDEVVRLCGCIYNVKQIRQMEEALLRKLSWHLCAPTASHFFEYYMSQMRQIDSRPYRLKVQQLLKTSLMQYELCQYLPSTLAATAICLAYDLLYQSTLAPVMYGQAVKVFSEPDALHFLIHLPSKELIDIYYCYYNMRNLSISQPAQFYPWSMVLLADRFNASRVFHGGIPSLLPEMVLSFPAVQ